MNTEVLSVWYRSLLLPTRSLWCESSSLDEVKEMSQGRNVIIEQLVTTKTTGDWTVLDLKSQDTIYDETRYAGQYLDAEDRPVVVLRRLDQPADYSQVKKIVGPDGEAVRIVFE